MDFQKFSCFFQVVGFSAFGDDKALFKVLFQVLFYPISTVFSFFFQV